MSQSMSPKIFWTGDSTVKENDFTSYPQTGLGQGMRLFLKKDIIIKNHAENGRSTKSFMDESRLAKVYEEIRENDFLWIQFGHNDAKIEDPTRYCKAFGEYQENLERFVNVARNRKAVPLLITPLCRRLFGEDGNLLPRIHEDYPEAMIEVACRLKVPYIDLYESSRRLITELGDDTSKKLFMHLTHGEFKNYPQGLTDDTHLTYAGAVAFSELIAKELKELGGVYKNLLHNPMIDNMWRVCYEE